MAFWSTDRLRVAPLIARWLPTRSSRSPLFTQALNAIRVSDWGTARELCEALLAQTSSQSVAARSKLHAHLALCAWQLGELDEADKHARQALALQACAAHARGCHELLAQICEHRVRQPAWYEAGKLSDRALSLQLLHPKHARAWFEQTRDPAIAALARLPNFADQRSTAQWLAERWLATCNMPSDQPLREVALAICHERRGFVGALLLCCVERSSFFSFWLGPSHRSLGLGQRALRVLERTVNPLGLRELFTATFVDNLRSQRALSSAGWQRLPLYAWSAHTQCVFYRWPPCDLELELDLTSAHYRLQTLLHDIDSDLTPIAIERKELLHGRAAN